MRFRTWPVAALGLLGLLGLIAFSLSTAYDRARGTSGQLEDLNQGHRAIFGKQRRVRSDVYLSAIYVRDYLLDNERERDPEYRNQLAEFRESSRRALTELSAMLPASPNGTQTTSQLRSSLDAYWKLLEPLFYCAPAEKAARAPPIVMPRPPAAMLSLCFFTLSSRRSKGLDTYGSSGTYVRKRRPVVV